MNTVMITGASSGLGHATALLFQARGWNVIATMRSPADRPELDSLDNVLVTRLDVEDQGSIDAAVEAGINRFGRIDALINNAGYGAYGPLELITRDTAQRQFSVNVLGLLATTRSLLPHFRRNHAGVVVNISSVGGRLTMPLGTLYHGSKFAVEGISEALQYELSAIGARVKIVEPGGIKTDFGRRSFDFTDDARIAEYQALSASITEVVEGLDVGTDPTAIAEIVYEATTDTSGRLRFIAGSDAEHTLADRASMDDETFYTNFKQRFGLN